jgi:hypothetical protein
MTPYTRPKNADLLAFTNRKSRGNNTPKAKRTFPNLLHTSPQQSGLSHVHIFRHSAPCNCYQWCINYSCHYRWPTPGLRTLLLFFPTENLHLNATNSVVLKRTLKLCLRLEKRTSKTTGNRKQWMLTMLHGYPDFTRLWNLSTHTSEAIITENSDQKKRTTFQHTHFKIYRMGCTLHSLLSF